MSNKKRDTSQSQRINHILISLQLPLQRSFNFRRLSPRITHDCLISGYDLWIVENQSSLCCHFPIKFPWVGIFFLDVLNNFVNHHHMVRRLCRFMHIFVNISIIRREYYMRDVESQWEVSRASKLLQIVSPDDKLHISVGFLWRYDHLLWPWDK